MEQHIVKAMNDEIVKAAALKFNVDFKAITKLGGFENFVYEYKKDNAEVILRFVHSSHRSFIHVLAEIEFIDYLSKNGANVSTVIHNIDDEISFKVPCENNEYFTVSAFSKAPGTFVKREEINDEFNFKFGQAVGRLHKLTKEFKPVNRRYEWHEDDFIEIGKRSVPKENYFVVEKTIELVEKIKQFDTSIEDYGLIHTDLHFGNMFYNSEELTFFDWDDASYKHFISDIAIIIFYQFGISRDSDEVIEDKTIKFLVPFLKGYKTVLELDKIWFERLNDFFLLRQLILIMVIYGSGDELVNSPFGQLFITKYLERIKNDKPFFNLQRVLDGIY